MCRCKRKSKKFVLISTSLCFETVVVAPVSLVSLHRKLWVEQAVAPPTTS